MSIPFKWLRQVASGAGGALYYRFQMDRRGENPVYSDCMEKLEEMLFEDILNHIDCQPWAEMK